MKLFAAAGSGICDRRHLRPHRHGFRDHLKVDRPGQFAQGEIYDGRRLRLLDHRRRRSAVIRSSSFRWRHPAAILLGLFVERVAVMRPGCWVSSVFDRDGDDRVGRHPAFLSINFVWDAYPHALDLGVRARRGSHRRWSSAAHRVAMASVARRLGGTPSVSAGSSPCAIGRRRPARAPDAFPPIASCYHRTWGCSVNHH